MLQLFLIMYGLPFIGISIDRMMVAYIGFIINYSAYFVEIIRLVLKVYLKNNLKVHK
jgi:His/Glu/Gln/Arg/opine family amino acid ABC transporter permease subunit